MDLSSGYHTQATRNAGTSTSSGLLRDFIDAARSVSGTDGMSMSGTRTNLENDPVGVTNQYDRSIQYKKKKVSSKQKKRQLKKIKEFNSLNIKSLSPQTVVRNNALTAVVTGTGQGYFNACLYGLAGGGLAGATEGGIDDLWAIFNNENSASRNMKLYFKNAFLDMTITNSSATSTVELDVYEYYAKQNVDEYNNLTEVVEDAQSDASTIGAAAALTLTSRGCSPFDLSFLGKSIIIRKKTKYVLSPGQVATYQMKDFKTRSFGADEVLDYNPATTGTRRWNIRGTQGCLLVGKPTPGGSGFTMDIGVTRKYSYRKQEFNETKDAIIV